MNDSKSNFNQAVWLSISYTCSMLVGIVSSAILSRYFDKTEYGTYKQIIFVYQIMLTLFQVGLPSVFTYFLPRYSEEECKYIVKTINMVLFGLGLLFSITLYLLSDVIALLLKNPELSVGIKIFSIFPLFTLPTLGVEGIYTVKRNTRFIAFYQISTRVLMLLCIVLPVLFINNSYKTALWGWGFASFITFLIAIIAKNKAYQPYKILKVDRIFHSILKYTLPIMGASVIAMLYNSSNQFFISRYFGEEEFAEYSNGYLTLPFVAMFIAPVRTLLAPLFSKANKDNDYTEVLNTMYAGMKQIATNMIPLIVFSFAFATDIMIFLYGDKYQASSFYFRLMIIFNFAEIFIFSGVLNAIGKTKTNFLITIICTLLLWSVCFVISHMDITTPYWFVIVFLVCDILCKYIMPGIILIKKENLKILESSVLKHIAIVLLHTITCVGITLLIVSIINSIDILLVRLIVSFLLYYLLLIITSRLIKVNYLGILKKFTEKK